MGDVRKDGRSELVSHGAGPPLQSSNRTRLLWKCSQQSGRDKLGAIRGSNATRTRKVLAVLGG